MTLVKWKPINPVVNMFDDLDIVFRSIFNNDHISTNETWQPAFSIKENGSSFIITGDLPGIDKDELDISIENDVLSISGNRKEENASDDYMYHRREVYYGRFSRCFSVPETVLVDEIKARFQNGSLTLTLPKSKVNLKEVKKINIS